MFPVICKIGPVSIYSYGLMLAVAVIVCAFFLSRDARSLNIQPEEIFDLVFWVVLGGISGARLFFIFLHLDFFLQKPSEVIMLQNGGLCWQGGLILGSAVGAWYIHKKKWSFGKLIDLIAPYIALGESIGRIGCFLNGCCYGKEMAWGIYFPVHGATLLPTQLYTSAGLLILFFLLKRYQSSSTVPGQVFIGYIFFASLLRFFIEFIRADHEILFWGLSIYQVICAALIGGAVFLQWLNRKRR
ncbi:MAG TPA: prolipoprotein diacylglyceryl transferase [Candidatus Omnitrophica bacterium]|nr:MAG: prolipoprotein diacylglyceryl transferase [Omnitrophica WOR_2 bacterium GWA2_45_18]OGX18715.1 MAG: prolipoprotein diacylglyceryl transferase [Omnitrophica WOR_2 bacterium GWC2_45_7]HBR14587.1 prolipoprotein diacylglyceryl transferase [Candidatus Omnitrophota bacterium]